ncbi:MAG: hypothetical protein ABR522_13245 [Marinobacter sp.]
MTALYHLATPVPEAERNARIYQGDLIVFRGFDAVIELTDRLRTHCINHLGKDPASAHNSMSPAGIDQAAEALRASVKSDRQVDLAWRRVLSAIDTALDKTYGDSIFVRVQPPGPDTQGGRTGPLCAHRDTWGSNLPAQINWWAPLFETTPERTLALFPGFFTHPVGNNSAGWNFQEMVQAQRTKSAPAYPLLPTVNTAPDWGDAPDFSKP